MTNLVPLSPILVLLIGAGVSLIPVAIPRFRVLVFLLSVLIAIILLLLNYRQTTGSLDILGTNLASPNLGLVLRFDRSALPFALVIFIFLSSHVLVQSDSFPPSESFGLLVTLAGALAYLLADNVATLAASWLLVDFGLLILPLERDETYERRLRAFGVSLIGLACLLVAGILAVDDSASLHINDLVLVEDAAALAIFSVWLRSGAWPFQTTAPATARSLLGRAGIPLLLGVNLMTRLLPQIQGGVAFSNLFQGIAVLGVAVSGLIVLLSQDRDKTLVWCARFAVAPIFLLPFLHDPSEASAIALWMGLGAFTFAAFASVGNEVGWLGLRIPPRQLLMVGALLCVGAFPLTPAFVGRLGLYGISIQSGLVWLLVLLAVTMTLVLVPLWHTLLRPQNDIRGSGKRLQWAGIGLLLVLAFILGVAPYSFSWIFGTAIGEGTPRVLATQFNTVSPAPLATAFLALLFPFLLSFFLARGWSGIESRLGTAPVPLVDALELNPLGRVFEGIWGLLARTIRLALALIEFNPIAWIVFFAIWVAVWILNS